MRAPSSAIVGDGRTNGVAGIVFTPPPARVGDGRIPATIVSATPVTVGGGVM